MGTNRKVSRQPNAAWSPSRPWDCGRMGRMAWCRLVTVLVFALLALGVNGAEAGQRHKWWGTGDIKTELQISDEQSATIEEIYQAVQPKLLSLMQALKGESQVLSELIDADDTEESDVARQIDRVETARGALGKERLLMIYRMNRALSVPQRAGLREWTDTNRRRSQRAPSNR